MRTPVLSVPFLLAATLGAVAAHGTFLRDPKPVSLVAACNASENPGVEPFRRDMRRGDNVEWREPSGRATSWEIVPKDTLDWPFASRRITGDQETPANSGQPTAQAQMGHIYGYAVVIHCTDGSTQNIDPEIIIGDTENDAR